MKDNIGLKVDVKDRHATWLELFYDLVYVIVIAKLTHLMGHVHNAHLDWHSYFQSVILFVPVWWCWIGHTMFANRFDADNTTDRILTLTQMFAVVMMAIFIEDAFDKGFTGFVITYVSIRALLIIMYLRVHVKSKDLRYITRLFSIGFSIGALCWIASLFIDAPWCYVLWGIGLLIDFATPWAGQKRLAKVSVHKDHLPERLGLLTIIVLGESVLGIVTGVKGIEWTDINLFNLVMAFMLLSSIWWFYFETLEHVLMGKNLRSGQLSIYGHLPIYIGLITVSAGLLHHITGNILTTESLLLLIIGLVLIVIPLHVMQIVQTPINKKAKQSISMILLYASFAAVFFYNSQLSAQAQLFTLTLCIIISLLWQHKRNAHDKTTFKF